MGGPRQVIVDDQVAAFLSRSVKSAFGLGLLVGQVSFSNVGDFVLAVVPIPSGDESNDTPTGLGDVPVDWVQEVSQQVDRLLPGGITVLGLYVVSTPNVSAQIVPFLRAVAQAVTLPSNVVVEDNVHYVAFVSSKNDISFQSFYDVTDVNKMQMLSARLKTPTTDMKLKQYRTLIDLDEPIPFVSVLPREAISATEVAEKRINEVENQLKPLLRRVQDSIAVLKLTGDTEAQHVNLLTLAAPKSKTLVKAPLGGILGGISCVAFVSESEPKANEVAATYLKRDFTKSLLVRLSLARERWADDDDVEPNAVFQEGGVTRLAQRGQVQWHSATVLSRHFFGTVHVFPDEDAVQAVKNAFEILGNDATNDGTSWAAMEVGSQLGSPMDPTFGAKKSEYSKYVYYLLPVGIVLILLVVQNLL
ncbi:unnamed protein product [Peronospora destructor]|uniref:Odr-4-like protein n=1 Tax=Peronospora destructor TaxID=86335 RepID=A0AAV0V7A0_9STRA|nr:unnamed protein product [Peronospora destructor]